jgi:O-antigen/teichoic acid export membrane protein
MNKDLLIIILGRVLQIVIMLISIRLLTTFLTPKEVGNYYIVLATLAFFNLVLLNPPGMYFSRHLLHWQKSKNILNALTIFIAWILIVAIISIPISIFIYHLLGYSAKFDLFSFIIYMFLAIFIGTIHRNIMGGSNTLGYRKDFVIFLISTLVLGLIFSIAIVYFFKSSALHWLMGIVLSEFLMIYIIFKFFTQNNKLNYLKIKKTLTKDKIKKVLTFSIPIGITTFLMWGQNTAYRFLIDYQYSAEVLGMIAVGLGVSSAVFRAIESISMQYFSPIFLKKILNASKEQRTEAWNNIAKQIVPIYILASFFTIAMAEVLVNILIDSKFHDSYIYTTFGVSIEFFRVMTNLLNSIAQSEYKTTYTIKPYLVGFIISLGVLSICNFGKNYFMIPIVLGFAYFLVYIYMYINMKKLLDIKYNINMIKIIFLSLPFSLIYFIDLKNKDIMFNFIVLSIFGCYFLFTLWVTHKENIKGDLIV